MAEARDWTTTMRSECPDCGYDASLVATSDFDQALEFEGAAWSHWLESADDAALRAHATQGVWSGLEYACHVRDIFSTFSARVDRLREGEPNPIEWWDHEAAVAGERYNEHQINGVADAIADNAMILGAATIGVEGDMWDLAAERRPGELFSIADLVRFALHESFHHRLDSFEAVSLVR